MQSVVNLESALAQVNELWSPKVVGRVNDQYVKVARVKGEFPWHDHKEEDELFYVVKGKLRIDYQDGSVTLGEGDFHVVPRATLHRPVAEEECWMVLIEPVATRHTGNVESPYTKTIEQQLA